MKGKEKTEELQKELLRIKGKIEKKMRENEAAPFTMDPSYFELMKRHHKRIEKIKIDKDEFKSLTLEEALNILIDKINEIIDILNTL